MNIENVLAQYGLKERQAKIYLACLEMGSATVLKISQKAGTPRSTTEVVLESLLRQGFVSSFHKKRAKYFSAEDPRKIVGLAKQKLDLLEQTLPQFMARYGKSKVRPTVRFYQGKSGMKLILEEILNEAQEVASITSAQDLYTVLDEYSEFVRRRVEKRIPVRAITIDSPFARERQRLGPQELREVRLVPESFDYHGMVYVWKNKIAMFSLEHDLVALVIESPTLAKMQLAMIDLIWQSLPPAPRY
jgi:sugar-specific transcriptional regulator TrmB